MPSDQGNAQRLVDKHGEDLKYCHPWKKWLVWDDQRWKIDDTGEVQRRAKDTARLIYKEASILANQAAKEPDEELRRQKGGIVQKLGKWARTSESLYRIEAMIKLAESEDGIWVRPDELDTNEWLLNCENGTINLVKGRLRTHRRSDLITKLAPVEFDPEAKCPEFDCFLTRIMAEDEDLIDFLQRIVGYGLTGDVSEQVLFILHGEGANGKSTFLDTVMGMIGDHAMKATPDLLMKNEGHPTEKTDLCGKRFVAATESEEGGRLAEVFVKEATGGDAIRARRMREDYWQFDPTHKLFLSTNHKPVIKGTDHAIWRRLKLLPFSVIIPDSEMDRKLPEKLKAEWSGILAWAVRGCLNWQEKRFGTTE